MPPRMTAYQRKIRKAQAEIERKVARVTLAELQRLWRSLRVRLRSLDEGRPRADVRKAYDPQEARDAGGKWTAGGGGAKEDAKPFKARTMDTSNIDPSNVMPVNPVVDEGKYEYLVASMKQNGWKGRPLLVYESGDGVYQALTGSHRIAAANAAGLETIPVSIIDTSRFDEFDVEDLENEVEDTDRLKLLTRFRDGGLINDEQLGIMEDELRPDSGMFRDYNEVMGNGKKSRDETENLPAMVTRHVVDVEGKKELDDYIGELKNKYSNIYSEATDKEIGNIEALERKAYRKEMIEVKKSYPRKRLLQKEYGISQGLYDTFKKRLHDRLMAEIKAGALVLAAINLDMLIKQMGEPIEIDTDKIAASYESMLGERITKTEESIKRMVGNKVVNWYSRDGSTLGELVDELSGTFDRKRAQLIAVTEVTRLNSNVQEHTARQIGVTEWWWATRQNESVCTRPMSGPDGRKYNGCRGLHGKVFKIGDPMPPDGSHPGCFCSPILVMASRVQPIAQKLIKVKR